MRRDILIIKLGALGDVVMATGLIDRILQHHAPRRGTLLTSPAYRELFPDQSGMEIKTFDRSSLRSTCLLYTSPSPRDRTRSRMPSSA